MKEMFKKILGINKPENELGHQFMKALLAGMDTDGNKVMVLDDKSNIEYWKNRQRTYSSRRSPEHIQRMKDSAYATSFKPLTNYQHEQLKHYEEIMKGLEQASKDKDIEMRKGLKSADDIREELKLNDEENQDLQDFRTNLMNAFTKDPEDFEVVGKDVDTRYNEPKTKPKVSEELISKTIDSTEIYRRAKGLILNAQRKQVGYGLDKYPEPLNADTWSTIETIDHIIDESIDKLHYLVMLKIKLGDEEKLKDNTHTLYADGEVYATYTDGVECPPPPTINEEHLEQHRRYWDKRLCDDRNRKHIDKAVSDAVENYDVHQRPIRRNDGLDSVRYAVDHYLRHKE